MYDDSADQIEIARLYYDYAWAIDAPGAIDAEGVAACFTEDARWASHGHDLVRDGREAIRDHMRTLPFESPMHHFMTNLRIDVTDDGQTAATTGYVMFYGRLKQPAGEPERIVTRVHRYTNSCRKVDGRWLFDNLVVAFQYGDAVSYS